MAVNIIMSIFCLTIRVTGLRYLLGPLEMSGSRCLAGPLEKGYSYQYWRQWTGLQSVTSCAVKVILTRLLEALQHHLMDLRGIFLDCEN
jgi:hypothetical protein